MSSNLSDDTVRLTIEGALFASQAPMDEKTILQIFVEDNQPSIGQVRQALAELKALYADRGVVLQEVASGYRFQVADKVMPHLSTMWGEKPQRMSRAFLETLALIAYRQPITRGEIEDIRGVTVSSQIIKTLLELEWIKIVGHKDLPGRPALLATTKQFLDHFNLKGLDELPTLAQIQDLEAIGQALAESESPDVQTAENTTAQSENEQQTTGTEEVANTTEIPETSEDTPTTSEEVIA